MLGEVVIAMPEKCVARFFIDAGRAVTAEVQRARRQQSRRDKFVE